MARSVQSVPVGANVDTVASMADFVITSPICVLMATAVAYVQNCWRQMWFIGYMTVVVLRTAVALTSRLGYTPHKVDWGSQVVVLTGGAHGIGLSLLHKLQATGARVAVIDILDVPLEPAKNLAFYKCNLADLSQMYTVLDQIESELGAPTILINNAGTLCPRLVHEQSAEDIDRVLNVNFIAPVQLTRRLLPAMLASPAAHIIFVSSALAYIGVPQLATYTASKAGLTVFYESLKLELRHRLQASHVKSTIFFPSKVQTGLFNGLQLPQWLSPELPTELVADRIFAALDSGHTGEMYMPAFANLVPLYMFCPQWARDIANWAANSIETMRTYKGYAPNIL
ncbi:hypothetical protein IWW55_000220 [Coemansia sp. RSA 2706]|nr:hypothetical protein IWW55_000220 [Coemansia sp. RSA 2706]